MECPSPASSADTRASGTDISSTSIDFKKYCATHPEADCIIGVNGGWYDVTGFRHRHPGGSLLLEKCHGKDATEIVESFHPRNVLKGWRPVGKYEQSLVSIDSASKAFKALHEEFLEKGFFKTSMEWYARKIAFTFGLLFCSIGVAVYFHTPSIWRAVVAGLFLGLFWQQCGFLMHDLMHNEMTHNRNIDRWTGMFFGSFCLGISSHWWRDEHFEHHAFTNVVDKETLYVDPQMQEEVWAQSPLLFPLYWDRGHWLLDWIQCQLVTFQHIFWIPFCVVTGRLAIIVNGIFKERRWYEMVTLTVHSIMMFCFCVKYFDSWQARMAYWWTASIYEGILHMQLLISHYAKPWTDMKTVLTTVDWYRLQVYCNINIKNPVWMDWFHGGLNFHIEHHLYPTMPRHRFREASVRVRQVCEEVGLLYDECYLADGILRTLKHLKEIGTMYKSSIQQKVKSD